jgi:PAS domain S-box-containing protein
MAMKFLIIDEDAVERSVTIKAILSKYADADIVEVGSSEELDAKFAEAGFDLAIIEYRFSWTDGLALFNTIKARYAALPVIMLTGSGSEDIAVAAIKGGMAHYIAKRNLNVLADEIERGLLEAKVEENYRAETKYRLYERRDPFISRFTPDFAYSARVSEDGKPVFEWVSKPLKQLVNEAGADWQQVHEWVLPIHQDDIPIVKSRYQKLLAGLEDTSEYRVIVSDSEIRHFSDHSLPVRDPVDDKVIRLYGVMQDITARRKVEEKLYLMQHAIDSSSNGIIITGLADTDYAIIYANAAFLRVTGYSMRELLGKNCRMLQNGDRDQPGVAELRSALQNNREAHAVLRNYRKDGSLFWSEIYISPIHDQQGRITHYGGVQIDVTQRVQMEYALGTSEATLRSIFNNVSDAIIIIDENGIITKLNPSARRLFGYSSEELIGHSINKLMPEPDRSRHDTYIKKHFTDGKASILDTRREVYGLKKDGTVFPMELGVSKFHVDQSDFFIGTAHDITERKRAEAASRDLSGHLETAREEERTRIAREIHDDLGSLLTALKMDLSWLNKQLPSDLSLCHDKITIMNRLLGDAIGSVRRIIADLRPSILDHLGLLAAIDWKLDEFSGQNGIQCALTVPEDNIVMDENKDIAVFRILQEALNNIALHSAATKVTVDVATDANSLSMTITDNGRGMTKAQMDKPGKYGILGMHERARHLGGKVTITSQPGKGTVLVLNVHLKSTGYGGSDD